MNSKHIFKGLTLLLAIIMSFTFVACGSGNAATSLASGGNIAETPPIIGEQVLLDNEYLTITAKGYDEDASIFGPSVKVLIENKSDKTLCVQVRELSINNYMIDATFSSTVDPGKKAYDNIVFGAVDLDNAHITNVGNIEFYFHIFDKNTWDTILDSDTINITTNTEVEDMFNTDGIELYNDNDVNIVYQGLTNNSIFGINLVFYITNDTDTNIAVQVDSASLNGFMIDPVMSAEIASGKKIVYYMTIYQSELEENEITSLENLEITFRILDNNFYETLYTTDTYNIQLMG